MEFLLGNPFSTPVGQCLEKATDGSLQSEDWTLNMEICDIINETEEGPKDAIRALKKRLNGNRNYREVMLALTVLETCVKNCGHRFHILVANRDFIDSVLVKIISPKNNPPTIVQDKVLALIQAWADAFRSSPDLTGVVHIYEELKRKGVEFPMADLDALSPIHTPQRSVPEVDPASAMPRSQSQQRTSASSYSSPPPAPYSAPQAPALSVTGPITANSEQIARLRSELDVVRGNTKVMSEMLTEMVPGQEDSSDLELLQELNRTCRAMQQRIVELISRVSNEEVTEELLHVNDDLNNVFLRYERFERYRSGRSVQNASNGVLNEVTEDNLIDLGPGSPAVVSPMVGNTAPPSSLSSQLAGLDLGTDSVSGTLSSLQQCNSRDGFDMFAQTRGNSLAEQRKTVTYEDPQAVGGLASALDSRKQNSEVKRGKVGDSDLEPIDSWLITQGMVRGHPLSQAPCPPSAYLCHLLSPIPVAQPSVMDDIEVWLRTDLKGDDLEEGVTSEEFDKFLEERAKAAEMVPNLPSPPVEAPAPAPAPGPASNPSGRKKSERSEDALFAL
ncbi:PREDICTED: TOM1-like protein 2 isoform X1 [Condylura cristata]|uniref:TOM1-like protein 2 isoform X1 n=1 Tax=Condylura cristata TaxID=143302 RepID=UPI000642EECA|nr:PREDICTED: TOM1-like protein 2 isoform X1 [Condylura cristata]